MLKALEEAGRIRRGYFVARLGATQFALPAALDLLRSLRDPPDEPEVVVLAATDPANPYGAILRWPDARSTEERGRTPTRSVGSLVVLVNGALAAYISRGERQLLAFLPEDEPARSTTARAVATTLARLGLLVSEINGLPAAEHPLAAVPRRSGLQSLRPWASRSATAASDEGRSAQWTRPTETITKSAKPR